MVCVHEARAIGCRPTALQSGVWPPPTEVARTCECRCGGPGWAAQRTRPLFLSAPTGPPAAAADAAQPLLSPGWFAGVRRCEPGCVRRCGGPGGPPQRRGSAETRPRGGGLLCFGIRNYGRGFCQTRETSPKAPRNSAVFSNLNQVQVEDAPPSWRRTEPIPMCLTL